MPRMRRKAGGPADIHYLVHCDNRHFRIFRIAGVYTFLLRLKSPRSRALCLNDSLKNPNQLVRVFGCLV